jgi:hypothetical protein
MVERPTFVLSTIVMEALRLGGGVKSGRGGWSKFTLWRDQKSLRAELVARFPRTLLSHGKVSVPPCHSRFA